MTLTQKYVWIVETLHRYGSLSLKELNEKWSAIDGNDCSPIPRQTFDRWKGGILDVFGVIIECDLCNGYRYYIENPEVLESRTVKNWVLESFYALQSVADNIHLENRILVEEIPSCSQFLTDILEAMKQNQILEMTYKSFNKVQSSTFLVEPYCVKLFQKRWYLLAHSIDYNEKRMYALDRIIKIHAAGETFKFIKDFDAKSWFSSFFGVVVDLKVKPEKIIIRANKQHREYLRSLPLHCTQKEIITTLEYSDFQLILRPTYDFCMELLKVGNKIEVISPQSLRHQMHNWAEGLWELYKDD